MNGRIHVRFGDIPYYCSIKNGMSFSGPFSHSPYFFILGLMLFITACGSQSNNPAKSSHAPKAINREEICKDIHNYYECEQAIEKIQIENYGDWVNREGETLHLKLDNGKTTDLKDRHTNDDNSIAFSFIKYIEEINAYLVSVQYYEGGSYLLIGKTSGDQTGIIGGNIAVSPDRQRVVIWNMDLEAGYTPNGFQVILVVFNRFSVEYEQIQDQWGPANARWISDTELELQKAEWNDEGELKPSGKIFFINDGQWVQKKVQSI